MITTPLAPIVTDIIGRTAELKGGAGNNQQARASDVNPIINLLNERAGANAVISTQTGTTNTTNAASGEVTFTSQNIAAGASATYTITNSYVTTTSDIQVTVVGVTSGATPLVTVITRSAGSFTVKVTNFTGATTYTSITLKFVVS